MKKYPKYKSSRIEWIGDIPDSWEVKRLVFIGQFSKGSGISKAELTESGEPVVIYGDIYTQYDIKTEKFIRYTTKEIASKSTEVHLGDLLFTGSGETVEDIGKTIVYLGKQIAFAGGDVLVFRQNGSTNSLFLSYVMNSNEIRFEKSKLAKGQIIVHIYSSQLKNISIPLPPLEEQTQIARYLDYKTNEIETLIANKQKLIELLQEERTATINQVVSKGINAKVNLKPSGIEWLGDIPEHWEVVKFNLLVKIRHGHQFMNYDFADDGIKIVKITQLHKDGYLDISNCSYIENNRLPEFEDIIIKENDILMCLTGGTIGKIIRVGKVGEPLLQNYRVGHFSSVDDNIIDNDFIFWVMSSESLIAQIFFQMRETGQPNIGMGDFGRMKIALPPVKEQKSIVQFIINETTRIDTVITNIKKEIELLAEYKTVMISEVVTGKVDVRNEVIK